MPDRDDETPPERGRTPLGHAREEKIRARNRMPIEERDRLGLSRKDTREMEAVPMSSDSDITPPPHHVDPVVWARLDSFRQHLSNLRKEVAALDDEVRDLQGTRAQLTGLTTDRHDHGRVGRLEERMTTVETKQSAHEKSLDRLDRIGWKIILAASLSGTATALLVTAAKWIAQR
jgi:hypothetical protein